MQYHFLAHQGHRPQHGEGCHGPDPGHKFEVVVKANEDFHHGSPELEVGGQALHGKNGHEVA